MKTLHWDAINPLTGQPFKWDDPNLKFVNGIGMYLEPGDPGFVPYGPSPPPPPKKPFHRLRKQHTSTNDPNTITNNIMSTFKYHVAPKAGGDFTTRVVLGPQITEADLTAQIAADASVTPVQAKAVVQALVARILAAAEDGRWSANLYGALTFRPACGGSETAPDMFHNADDLAATVQVAVLASVLSDWRGRISIQSQGEVGQVTPVIDTILSEENGAVDHYVAGTLIRLRGNHLKFKKTDVTQGVFFKAGAAAEVRATVYGILDPREVTVLVPAALSGPLTVRIAAFINGSVRSFTYTHPIT